VGAPSTVTGGGIRAITQFIGRRHHSHAMLTIPGKALGAGENK